MEIQHFLPIIAGIASFIMAGGFAALVLQQKAGTKEMQEISEAVRPQQTENSSRDEYQTTLPVF